MELLCWDPDCVGNDLVAGVAEDGIAPACGYCGAPLADSRGRVIAQGAFPLVRGRPAETFDEMLERTTEIAGVTLTPVDDAILSCSLTDDGRVLSAAVHVGSAVEEAEHLMALLSGAG